MNTIPELFFTNRSNRGRLKLTGRDRQTFLQGMVTNDVAALLPGQGCYAFLLDATGHVLADVRVLCRPDHLLLDTEPGMATFVAETLEKYLIMERVKITDITAETAQVSIGGVRAAENLWEGESREGDNHEGDQGSILAVTAWTNLMGFDAYLPDTDTSALIGSLQSKGATPLSAEVFEALRIEAGIPRFGVDIDSRVLAPETGQQKRAIHYRKGCYIGQEIVARIDARGHTNRGLAGFWLTDDSLPPGETPVSIDNKEVGRVTSAAFGPTTNRPIALGYIRHEYREPGTVVQIAGQTATVATLPFSLNEINPQ